MTNQSSTAIDSIMDLQDGYRGIHNLKRVGQKIAWTPELASEFMKCKEDPIYFGENYMKIVSLDHGLITPKLYEYQKEIILSVCFNRRTIAECARQSGKTTALTIAILWYAIFHDYKTVAILANKGATAQEILDRIQTAYMNLPDWLQQGVVEWNKTKIELENGSIIFSNATSKTAIRGYSINMVFIDEAAHIENWEDFWTAVSPTLASGKTTKAVLVSTVNGLNHFHDFTQNARKGQSDYNLISVSWQDVPERDEAWKQATLADLNFDYERFAQEYENEYLGSSGTLISGSALKYLSENTVEPKYPTKAGLSIFHEPDRKGTYVLVADVSRGKGLDYSAFQIIDVSKLPYVSVAVFKDNMIPPVQFAEIINRVGRMYNDAFVLVEVNDIGGQVADLLHYDFEYENMVFSMSKGARGKVATFSSTNTTDRGIRTTITVKSVGCSMLKLLIEQDKLQVRDRPTVHELSTFSAKGKSYEAEPGHHDDLVMCLVLFAWFSEQQLFKQLTDINTLMSLREDSIEQIENDLSAFGFADNGVEDSVDMSDALDLQHHNDENWFLVE